MGGEVRGKRGLELHLGPESATLEEKNPIGEGRRWTGRCGVDQLLKLLPTQLIWSSLADGHLKWEL